jgi:hypothetical protein
MGYDIHITRQENWFDDEESRMISFNEWTEFLATDPEMRRENSAEAVTSSGDFIRVDSDGLSVWIKYSGNNQNGNFAWFDYYKGNIVCKNPDYEIINKMLDIAERLNAKVQGDDGELYGRTADMQIYTTQSEDNKSEATTGQKPWWKFW